MNLKEREIKKLQWLAQLESDEIPLKVGQEVIAVDPKYHRPTEVDLLIGDPTKAQTKLGWKPEYDLAGLVKENGAGRYRAL